VFQFEAAKRALGKGKLEQVGQTIDAGVRKHGDDFAVDGVFQVPLMFEKSGSGCGTYAFTYGDKDD
jgi:hypothetical protein